MTAAQASATKRSEPARAANDSDQARAANDNQPTHAANDSEPPRAPNDNRQTLAQATLSIALAEVGRGESGRNNDGPDVIRYRRGQRGYGSWCAAFVSYCAEQAANELNITLPFKRSHGAKRLYRAIGEAGSFVNDPQPGDVVCWHRGPPGAWTGHIGIVVEHLGVSVVNVVEGNIGKFPAFVAVRKHDTSKERFVGFARMPAGRIAHAAKQRPRFTAGPRCASGASPTPEGFLEVVAPAFSRA